MFLLCILSVSGTLPQSESNKIKEALLRALQLPAELIHKADVEIRKIGGEAKIVIIADENKIKSGFHKFIDLFKRHDKFENDIVNESGQKEFVFSVPSQVKHEVNQLLKIENAEDGVANRTATVNQLTQQIKDKFPSDAVQGD